MGSMSQIRARKSPRKQSEAQNAGLADKGCPPDRPGEAAHKGLTQECNTENQGGMLGSVHMVPFCLTWFQLSFATKCLD